MIKAIFFDLDGTLLPMDQDKFVNAYMTLLAKKASKYGYESDLLIKTIWQGTKKMLANDGSKKNEEIFWDVFTLVYGKEALKDKNIFDEFYYNEFQLAKDRCGYNKLAKEVVDKVKEKGYKLVLATNPVFPAVATESRIKWAGVNPNDFDIYTTYENSYHSKPNLEYYKDLLRLIDCDANECVMIGNDVDEDMIAESLGMDTFLLTDCLINKSNKDISGFKQGNFDELLKYIENLK